MQIRIVSDGFKPMESGAVIVVPEKALKEAGFIRTLTANQTAQSKHEFHALAQTALMQLDDQELTPERAAGEIRVIAGDEILIIDQGTLIVRLQEGGIVVLSNAARPIRKYLECAHRFCTRWIRLDI